MAEIFCPCSLTQSDEPQSSFISQSFLLFLYSLIFLLNFISCQILVFRIFFGGGVSIIQQCHFQHVAGIKFKQ